jgi:hypothetical protein
MIPPHVSNTTTTATTYFISQKYTNPEYDFLIQQISLHIGKQLDKFLHTQGKGTTKFAANLTSTSIIDQGLHIRFECASSGDYSKPPQKMSIPQAV